jgi:hypothetical protein
MSLRRVYETTVIINAALEDADIDAVISKITSYIESMAALFPKLTNGDAVVLLIRLIKI